MSQRETSERIGPGVMVRRAASSAPRNGEVESKAAQLTRQRDKSLAGKVAGMEVAKLLSMWRVHVGPPHHLLDKQMPQFHADWGFERMREAIALVAKSPAEGRDAWGRMQQLVHQLRVWRRARR
jgi:hypothetical protein